MPKLIFTYCLSRESDRAEGIFLDCKTSDQQYLSGGDWVVKLLACRAKVLTPSLATWISEFGYFLLPSPCTVYRENFAPFYFRPFRPLPWRRFLNWANWIICKGLYRKIWERANSRLGVSVLDPYRAKIRLGEFKAVYSMTERLCKQHKSSQQAKTITGLWIDVVCLMLSTFWPFGLCLGICFASQSYCL